MRRRLKGFVTFNKEISRKFENFKEGLNTIKNNIKTMSRKWCHNHCLYDYFRKVTKRFRCYIVYIYTFSLVVEFNISVDHMMCSINLKNNKSN